MPGARHTDWTHVHVRGERDRAAPYVGFGRKLLGAVTARGLDTYSMTRRLPDGAVVTAEVRGGIPRITITPVGGTGRPERPRVREHFVIRMRSAEQPDGIDPDTPETLERVDDDAWRTLFHSANTPGYAGFAGPKGTYRSQNGIDVFPAGVTHAGNVDWRGPEGQRVSFYGPSTRYFVDPYVRPRSQYGRFVFMLGQVLLDVDAYIDESQAPFAARYVMGAALRGRELIVVHADLPETIDFPTGTAPAGDKHVSMPWPVQDVSLEVARYALAPTPPGEAAPFLRVLPKSRTVLAAFTARNAWQPWFFNPDASAAVSHGLPDAVLVRPTIDFTALDVAPSTSSQVHTLTLAGDAVAHATTTVSLPPDGEAVLASDFDAGGVRIDLRAGRARNQGGFDTRELRLDGTAWRLRDIYDFRTIGGRPGSTYDRRHVVWVDLRERVLVLATRQSWQRLNAPSPVLYRQFEVWQRGALVGTHMQAMRSEYDGEFSGLRRLAGSYADDFDDANVNHARAVAFAPAQVLYEILDYSPQTSFRTYWQGAHGLHLILPYPSGDYFGSVVEGRNANGNPYVEFSEVATGDAAYCYTQRDVHGRPSVTGCASHDGTTVYSGWQVNVGGYVDDEHAATFALPHRPHFPHLTGTQTRCLPVWLLGTLPRALGAP